MSGGKSTGPSNDQCSRRWRAHVNPEVSVRVREINRERGVCVRVCVRERERES